MSAARVLKLEDHRHRRLQRLALIRACAQGDLGRAMLVRHLTEVTRVTGADRAAIVWVDEYGPEMVHSHVVVDLFADRPRLGFAKEPLQRAWESGIPGTYDEAGDPGANTGTTMAVALGSDGARGWFLVADCVAGRPAFDAETRSRLMFLAGECSALVLHRDLDESGQEVADERFAGWQFLQDLVGHESDEKRGHVVARRFIVGRLVRMLLDEDLAVADVRRAEQVERAREQLATESEFDDPDAELLDHVLEAYGGGDLPGLTRSLLLLGESVERVDHANGALELYRCAFEIAGRIAESDSANLVSRRIGRLLRRRASWDESGEWYQTALTVAQAVARDDLVAHSLLGMGLINKERGNLPGARIRFEQALEAAEGSGDRDAIATVFHDFLGLEHAAGDLTQALRCGWKAVHTFESSVGRTRCLTSLAGVLKEAGDLEAAEDAYLVVAHTSDEHYYLVYAHDALAHLAALRGDRSAFDIWARRCDELDWESGPRSAKAEILFYRGHGYAALGEFEEARGWFTRAVDFASQHGFSRVLFDAERELSELDERSVEVVQVEEVAPDEIREGLRALRTEVATVG